MILKHGVVAFVLCLCCCCHAEMIWSCGFESDEGYTSGVSVDGQNGWRCGRWANVWTATDTDWAGRTGDCFLGIGGPDDVAYSPDFDTAGYPEIRVAFDLRPSELVSSSSAVYVLLYGDDDKEIIRFLWSVEGVIKAYEGYDYDYLTPFDWEYIDKDTVYHVVITLDQICRYWSLEVNGQSYYETTLQRCKALANYNASWGKFKYIKFQSGEYNYGSFDGTTLIDNVKVFTGPLDCAEVQRDGYSMEADINGDCKVDSADLAILFSEWLESTDPGM